MAIDQKVLLNLDFIIDILSKWRWAIIVPLLIAMVIGSYFSIKLPKIYQAETLILIQPQKVPSDFVQNIVTSETSDRINTLSQQILSRSNLERIINKFSLFSSKEASSMYMEDKVNSLRSRILVQTRTSRRRRGSNSFVIKFKGPNPEIVMNVTNELAYSFIDENVKIRQNQALSTSDFLDAELQSMRQKLEEKEAAVKSFRENSMGELPEQLETNLRILDRLQQQHTELLAALRDAKMRLVAIQQNQNGIRPLVAANEDIVEDPYALDLNSLKIELSRLQSRYTDKHPDIIKLKARIKELEQNKASVLVGDSSPPRPYIALPVMEIQNEIRTYESDIQKIRQQIKVHENRVEATPRREQELLALKRDYTNLQEAYQNLLSRRIEAEISVNMERKQKGEQFRIVDRAKLPKRPIEPNMKMILMITMAAGFGVGAVIIFSFEFMRNTFHSPKEIENLLGLPTLAMITVIQDRKSRILAYINSGATIVSILATTTTIAFFVSLTLNGVESTLQLISKLKQSIFLIIPKL